MKYKIKNKTSRKQDEERATLKNRKQFVHVAAGEVDQLQ